MKKPYDAVMIADFLRMWGRGQVKFGVALLVCAFAISLFFGGRDDRDRDEELPRPPDDGDTRPVEPTHEPEVEARIRERAV